MELTKLYDIIFLKAPTANSRIFNGELKFLWNQIINLLLVRTSNKKVFILIFNGEMWPVLNKKYVIFYNTCILFTHDIEELKSNLLYIFTEKLTVSIVLRQKFNKIIKYNFINNQDIYAQIIFTFYVLLCYFSIFKVVSATFRQYYYFYKGVLIFNSNKILNCTTLLKIIIV